jgi:hypothetical protein
MNLSILLSEIEVSSIHVSGSEYLGHSLMKPGSDHTSTVTYNVSDECQI